MLKEVVLPAPFGPSNPTISPALTWIETPLTTRRWRYCFTSLSVVSSGPVVPAAVWEPGSVSVVNGSVVCVVICRSLPGRGPFRRVRPSETVRADIHFQRPTPRKHLVIALIESDRFGHSNKHVVRVHLHRA